MVVLQLGPFPPPHGGVQTNLVAIRDHLHREGIRAPVINLTRHRREDADDVFYPRSAWETAALLWKTRADVVHLHVGGHLTTRLLALSLYLTMLPRRRSVLTFHSGGYPSWQREARLRPFSVRGFILRRFDAIVAVNGEIAEMFRRFGVPASRIHVITPFAPVSLEIEHRLPEPLARFCSDHRPVLTTIGLLEPEYDLPLQIAALGRIRRRFPRAGLVIVGSGSLESDLRAHIGSSPEREHILLSGDVRHQDAMRLLSESDLFLRTTLYDGDSVSVREALQLGVPVVATDNGMRPARVHLIPRGNAGALVDAACAVLTQPAAVRHRRGQGAADRGAMDDMMSLYRDLTPLRAPSHSARFVGEQAEL